MNKDILILIICILSFICGFLYHKKEVYKSYYEFNYSIKSDGIDFYNAPWNKRKIYNPIGVITMEPKNGWQNRINE